MGFWFFMMIMVLIIPCMLFGFGNLFLKTPPRTINTVFGYRTKRSMRNIETWNYAHKYIGKLWKKCGIIAFLTSLITMLCIIGQGEDMIGTVGAIVEVFQILLALATIIPTEQALKKKFG